MGAEPTPSEPEVIAMLRNREWPYKEPVSSYRHAILAAYDACAQQRDAAKAQTRDAEAAMHTYMRERDAAVREANVVTVDGCRYGPHMVAQLIAERDAAVRELDTFASAVSMALTDTPVMRHPNAVVEDARILRARLAACERDLNYIRRVTVGAVESDKLAATCKTIGEYRYVLLKEINAMGVAAAPTPETGGENDA